MEQAREKYKADNMWENTCSQTACLMCGKIDVLPGSYKWKGKGCYAYLNQRGGDRRPPVENSYRYECDRRFQRTVPRPPDGWMGLSAQRTDNGGEPHGGAAP